MADKFVISERYDEAEATEVGFHVSSHYRDIGDKTFMFIRVSKDGRTRIRVSEIISEAALRHEIKPDDAVV